MSAAALQKMIEDLSTEQQDMVISFIQFLQFQNKQSNKDAEIFDSLANEMSRNSPWKDEKEMLKEMSDFRRKRMKNENID